jgi:hypothetical protein
MKEQEREWKRTAAIMRGDAEGFFDFFLQEFNALPSEKIIRIRTELQAPPEDIARQHGGPVQAGVPYIVGEAGPELFVPYTAGQIVSNSQTYNSQDTYNLMTASASSVAMTRRRQRISRLMG